MTSVESEILALLAKARSFVKETEFLFCNSFPVPAINEFRNVSYHLAEYIQSPNDPIQDQIRKQKAIARQWIIGILIAIVTSVIGYLISFFA